MNEWQLWEKKSFATVAGGKKFLFQTDFAFVRPDGIINEHRRLNPYGCVPFWTVYEFDLYCIWDFKGQTLEFLKQFDGWKKARTKMTVERWEKANFVVVYLRK